MGPPQLAVELGSRTSFWYGVVIGRLQQLAIASPVDSELVMLLAIRLEEIEESTEHIRQNGARYAKLELIEVPIDEKGTLKTKAQKSWKANPAVSQRSEAMRHAQSLLSEFGLSPSSRQKVSKLIESAAGAKPDDPWANFN